MIRVALVDDHSIVRRGLGAYLAAQSDIVVAGEASSGEEALANCWKRCGGAAQGKAILDPALMQRVMQAQTLRHNDVLTERESDVLKLVTDGMTNAEIASRLVVNEETVKTHVASILRKLNLAHRTQAAVYAIRNGGCPNALSLWERAGVRAVTPHSA